MRKRIADGMAILKRLDMFWHHSDCSMKQKVLVFNSVLRSKLVYGLESLELIESMRQKLDVFQLKGLRKILRMQTTYVNRANTTQVVYEQAAQVCGYNAVVKLSEYYKQSKLRLFAKILQDGPEDPRMVVTFEPGTLHQHDHGKRRVGRPKQNWVISTTQEFWQKVVKEHDDRLRHTEFDPTKREHIEAMLEGATNYDRIWANKRQTDATRFEQQYRNIYG